MYIYAKYIYYLFIYCLTNRWNLAKKNARFENQASSGVYCGVK